MDFLISPNFLLGLFGALITLYLAKQVVIPELRPLYDTSDIEKESKSLRALTDDARQRIAAVLNQMGTETPGSGDLTRRLDGLETALQGQPGAAGITRETAARKSARLARPGLSPLRVPRWGRCIPPDGAGQGDGVRRDTAPSISGDRHRHRLDRISLGLRHSQHPGVGIETG